MRSGFFADARVRRGAFADADGAADGHDDLHRGMEGGGVEEGEAMFAERGCAVGGGEGDGDAEGFEDVG